MEGILLSLAVLACPLGMVLMMMLMGRGMMGGKKSANADRNSGDDVGTLRAESARLDGRIAELEARGVPETVER
ncbi:hypothetical protein [Miltoncostaea oceani]|uniref:hypothetical protein n=1 Tax=Miltoncostaea oceani TaxID=2843216 RepID=UPI001C3CD3CF|nr:hypothetical protein [Miltoncostaea oceani]